MQNTYFSYFHIFHTKIDYNFFVLLVDLNSNTFWQNFKNTIQNSGENNKISKKNFIHGDLKNILSWRFNKYIEKITGTHSFCYSLLVWILIMIIINNRTLEKLWTPKKLSSHIYRVFDLFSLTRQKIIILN